MGCLAAEITEYNSLHLTWGAAGATTEGWATPEPKPEPQPEPEPEPKPEPEPEPELAC